MQQLKPRFNGNGHTGQKIAQVEMVLIWHASQGSTSHLTGSFMTSLSLQLKSLFLRVEHVMTTNETLSSGHIS